MTPYENLHYAIGLVAYAMAGIDGKIQQEERTRFHDIVVNELRGNEDAFNLSDIIFRVLDHDQMDAETAYEWAINEIRSNSHYLSPELKSKSIRVAEKIAAAYPPVTPQEQDLLERFKSDLAPLEGDPVFYRA